MLAGRLDQRITIQRMSAETQNAANEPRPTWVDHFTVWAQYKPLTVNQRYAAERFISSESGTFTIRMRKDWGGDLSGSAMESPSKKLHRISYDGRFWDITGATRIGKNRGEGWEISAEVSEHGGADQE